MGLQALIQKFSRYDKPLRIHRYARGDYRGGIFNAKVKETFTMLASVQPVQQDAQADAIASNGLARRTDAIKVFSVDEILLDDPASKQKADRVEYNGVLYEAKSQGPYRHPSLGHYETICVKVADL